MGSASISAAIGISLEDTAFFSMTPQVLASRTLPLPRQTNLSKDKKLATAQSKRAHDGNESEPVRKRPSSSIKLTDSTKLRKVALAIAQVLALRVAQGEGSSMSSFFPLMRESFKLSESGETWRVLPKRFNELPYLSPTFNYRIQGWEGFLARPCCIESWTTFIGLRWGWMTPWDTLEPIYLRWAFIEV